MLASCEKINSLCELTVKEDEEMSLLVAININFRAFLLVSIVLYLNIHYITLLPKKPSDQGSGPHRGSVYFYLLRLLKKIIIRETQPP